MGALHVFNLVKTLVLVPHKKQKCQVKKPKYKKVAGQAARIKNKIELPLGGINHPRLVHTKFYSRH